MSLSHQFVFGIYPYICGAIFLLGSLIRFDRDQYTWRSESSQMLSTGMLRAGSNLFHLGIIGLFFGHFFGMLTPADLVQLPKGQAFALIDGGQLWKIRIPLADTLDEVDVPTDIEDMAHQMRALSTAHGTASQGELTVPGKGSGW